MRLLLLLCGLFALSYYVIYINYVVVWIYKDPTMEMTHDDYPLSPLIWAWKS